MFSNLNNFQNQNHTIVFKIKIIQISSLKPYNSILNYKTIQMFSNLNNFQNQNHTIVFKIKNIQLFLKSKPYKFRL